jgi:hypothetical protein
VAEHQPPDRLVRGMQVRPRRAMWRSQPHVPTVPSAA